MAWFTLFSRGRKKNNNSQRPVSGRWTLREMISGRRQNEIRGMVWWAVAVFLIAAVWPHAAGQNALGLVGELLFRGGYALAGVLIYLLPLLAAIYGWLKFRDQEIERGSYKLLGLALAALAVSILVQLIHPEPVRFTMVKSFYIWQGAQEFWAAIPKALRWWGTVSLPAGGIIAEAVARILVTIFSRIGTYIVAGTVLIISLYLLEAEPYLVRVIQRVAEYLRKLFKETQRQPNQDFAYAPKSKPPAKVQPTAAATPAASASVPEARPKIKINAPPPLPGPLPVPGKPAQPAPKPEAEKPEALAGAAHAEPETRTYQLPGLELLADPKPNSEVSEEYFERMSQTLENALSQFGVAAKVVEVCPGPVVTRYELQPSPGVKVNRIISLEDDIALAMKAEHVRIEAPIPGKGAVGIEIPNQEKQIVVLKEFIADQTFKDSESILTFAVGKDIGGKHIFAQLEQMPHLLIAGATGSGKSACINSIISSLLYQVTPHQVRFLMIDPKRVELTIYNGIPHLKSPVINDNREAAVALKLLVREMEERYKKFSELGVRDITGYNQQVENRRADAAEAEASGEGAAPEPVPPHMPYILVFIDELADLMMLSANEVENTITRLAQMARGVGIHMVLATQRPSVDVITGVIKANFPSRIAFQVSSKVDSRTILDANGADALLGRGDMLYAPASAAKQLRVQGVFITTAEVERLVRFWKKQGEPVFDSAFSGEKLKAASTTAENGAGEDELFKEAVGWVVRAKQASTSMLQRRLKVGYSRAARLLDLMEEKGIVGPPEGSKPRKVLIPPEEVGISSQDAQEDRS